MIIYAIIKNDETGENNAFLISNSELREILFSPVMTAICIIDFVIHGKTYAEKKDNLRNMAIEYSNNQVCWLFQSDILAINNYFAKNAMRY